NRTRSRSGWAGLLASSRTRSLKASQDNSRLIYNSVTGSGAAAVTISGETRSIANSAICTPNPTVGGPILRSVGRDHFVGNSGYSGHAFGERKQRLTLCLRTDKPPEMHNTTADRNVPVAKTCPRLISESRQQLKPNLAVRLVVLVEPAAHRGERLDQIGA